jgi:hypothetical protein
MYSLCRSYLHHFALLLLLACLAACDQAREAERLLTSAEQAKQEGQLTAATALYRRAAELRPRDFETQYQAALLDLQVGNVHVVLVRGGHRAEARQEF